MVKQVKKQSAMLIGFGLLIAALTSMWNHIHPLSDLLSGGLAGIELGMETLGICVLLYDSSSKP